MKETVIMHQLSRMSGILLHPTSLPSPYGIGDLGLEARRFIDFLVDSGQHLWQLLPLTHKALEILLIKVSPPLPVSRFL